mmetsp:Transcript_100977/g.159189  ORF Transcript_100977/g.159189 Transcript_100977/m.159189 type:complete len:228 (-) Transcript_100977:256-939(-)
MKYLARNICKGKRKMPELNGSVLQLREHPRLSSGLPRSGDTADVHLDLPHSARHKRYTPIRLPNPIPDTLLQKQRHRNRAQKPASLPACPPKLSLPVAHWYCNNSQTRILDPVWLLRRVLPGAHCCCSNCQYRSSYPCRELYWCSPKISASMIVPTERPPKRQELSGRLAIFVGQSAAPKTRQKPRELAWHAAQREQQKRDKTESTSLYRGQPIDRKGVQWPFCNCS